MNYVASRFLAFDPFLTGWVLFAALTIIGLVTCLSLWRAKKSRLLRVIFGMVFTLCLLNPTLIQEEREGLPSVVALVVDASESMDFGERADLAHAVKEKLTTELTALGDITLRVVETQNNAQGTRVITALQDSLADVPREQIGGAVLISDGQIHDVPDSLSLLSDYGPIHSLVTGDPNNTDRRIEIVKRTNFGVVGDKVKFTVRAIDPALPGGDIPLVYTLNGQSPKRANLKEGEDKILDLEVERRGENLVVFEVPAGQQELTLANNAQAEKISGVFDRLRVLLITGHPNAAGRVWRDLLRSDPGVDLVHFTILRPPFKGDGAAMEELSLINFPADELFEEKLDKFNLIIFDQYERRHVITDTYLNNMARYVDEGGALLVVSGPPFASRFSIARSPLRSVLSAAPNSKIVKGYFTPEITTTGKRHSVTAPLMEAEEKWGGWYRYIGAKSDVGDIVMQTPTGGPLLVLNRVGNGRVGQLLSDQIWLWARGHKGGGPYADLLRRLVHWLMKEPELEERKLVMELDEDGGALAIKLESLADAAPPLTVETPKGQIRRLPWTALGEGAFKAEIYSPELGLYRAKTADLKAVALKGPVNEREYKEPSSTLDILRPISEITGGGIRQISSPNDMNFDIRATKQNEMAQGRNWIGFKKRDAYVVKNSKAEAILPGPIGAFLCLLTAIILWWREGR